jgi:4-oxalocrotonate tautomerase
MPMIHIHVPAGSLDRAAKRAVIEAATRAAVEAEGVPVTDLTWVLIHEIAEGGWGARGQPLDDARARPIVEISTPVGWVTIARKHKMVTDVARAVAMAAGVDGVAYVIVHEIPDGGWGWEGRSVPRDQYQPRAAPDLP